MRRLPVAVAVALVFALPAPALAEDAAPETRAMAQLADPATQQQAAMMAQAMGEILLDMPVAPLLDAAEQMAGRPVGHVDRDARVADLVGPDARRAPAAIAERLPAMMGAVAQLAGAFEEMAPRLREIAERLPRAAQ